MMELPEILLELDGLDMLHEDAPPVHTEHAPSVAVQEVHPVEQSPAAL